MYGVDFAYLNSVYLNCLYLSSVKLTHSDLVTTSYDDIDLVTIGSSNGLWTYDTTPLPQSMLPSQLKIKL